jgi:hypothetical protein
MVAAAGIATTELSAVEGGEEGGETDGAVGDDPQPDRVNTADRGMVTKRLLIQLEFISLPSVEGEIEGTSRALQWTPCQLFFNSSSTGNALY